MCTHAHLHLYTRARIIQTCIIHTPTDDVLVLLRLFNLFVSYKTNKFKFLLLVYCNRAYIEDFIKQKGHGTRFCFVQYFFVLHVP